MKVLSPQYITDEKGKKISVVLSIKDYKQIMKELDELEEIHIYNEVKAKKEKSIPFDEYLKQRKQKLHT